MATYLERLSTGVIKQVTPIVTSAGAGDSSKLVQTDAGGKLDETLFPSGIGSPTKSMTASEALSANDLVNIWDDAGTEKIRKADAANGMKAHGYVKSSITLGNQGTVYFDGEMTGLTGLTPGANQYLSETPGGRIEDPSTLSAGSIQQLVGQATSPTSVLFEPDSVYELA